MDAALNRKSFFFGVPGIVLQLGGRLGLSMVGSKQGAQSFPMANDERALVEIAATVGLVLGTCLLIAGLSCYARAKGRSGWWGLMGLLSIIGLIVLACLEDRNKASKKAA